MPYLPTWLNQPDFLGAIRSGAGLGLQRREVQDRASLASESLLQNREAGINRLQLAYDQLAAEQDWRNEAIQERREEAAARWAEQLRAANALENYRESQTAHNAVLERLRERALELREDESLYKMLSEESFDPTHASVILDPETGKRIAVSLPTGKGSARPVLDQVLKNQMSAGAENALRSRIDRDTAILGKTEGVTPEQKAFAADDLKRAQSALGISLTPEVTSGEKRSLYGLDFLAKDAPAKTNLVVRSLAQPPPQEGTVPKAVNTFDDEAEARADGYGAGDIIILRGVGKVRLK